MIDWDGYFPDGYEKDDFTDCNWCGGYEEDKEKCPYCKDKEKE